MFSNDTRRKKNGKNNAFVLFMYVWVLVLAAENVIINN